MKLFENLRKIDKNESWIKYNKTISPLFVNRFKCSLLVCQLDFDKEAISDDFGIGGVFWILSDLRGLSSSGPCGSCISTVPFWFAFFYQILSDPSQPQATLYY